MAKTKVHGEYLDPSVISGQTQVTAVGADSMLIFDATDNALKKALLSDLIETVGSTPTFSQISATSDLTLDVGGDIILDADGADIRLKDAGTEWGRLVNNSSNFLFLAPVADKDIMFNGVDGSSEITALTLDMSDAGAALFNGNIALAGGADRRIQLSNSGTSGVNFSSNNTVHIRGDNDSLKLNSAANGQIILESNGVEQAKFGTDGYLILSRNSNEYGLELRSTGTRSGLVLATPNSGNTIKGSLLLLADNTLRLGTQSVYNIHMNQSGHNTMPNQPYMRARGNYAGMATSQGTTVNPWNHWAVQSSSGITHSSGVFTVPTAGRYLITYSFYLWINNSGGGHPHAVMLYVGSTNVQENSWEADLENDAYAYYDNTTSNSIVYDLNAGDTFKFVTYADTYGGTSHTTMSAYLLG